MLNHLEHFLLAWIPLFVALDPLGLIPVYLGMTEGIIPEDRRRITAQASWTAALVAIGFMFLGRTIFRFLNITVADFQVAGGLILLAFAVRDLLAGRTEKMEEHADMGVVPLGLPLIVGPATLTILLILIDSVGFGYTLAALVVNLVLVNLALHFSEPISRLAGIRGLRAISKIVSLLLAAIAVSMIRQGWRAP